MSSPAKRPALTYQRRSTNKIPAISPLEPSPSTANFQSSSLLNPDAALQDKINCLLFSDKNKFAGRPAIEEDEFDSAYHETSGNAKKVHDLVQSGETRRFIDEIEYLLDGIQQRTNSNSNNDNKNNKNKNSKSNQLILCSLQEIIEKCFDQSTKRVQVNFAMKLKSHGALGIIFDSLQIETDPKILDKLVLLVVGLLYDVRRMDFFFKPELAVKLVQYCFEDGLKHDQNSIDTLKSSQLFSSDKLSDTPVYEYVGIWILYKWTFSSLTSKNNSSFFTLLQQEPEILKRVIKIVKDGAEEGGKKTAGLLDYLIANGIMDLKKYSKDLIGLLKNLVNKVQDVSFMKLAVSITGSPLLGKQSDLKKEDFFELVQSFTDLLSPIEPSSHQYDIVVLALSCLINLMDRCNDSFIDEFRYQKCKNSLNLTLLEYLTRKYVDFATCHGSDNETTALSTLLALLLGFICRQNRTNLQVILSFPSVEASSLKKDIFTVASNFYLQQEKSLKRTCHNNREDTEIIVERLNEIILAFKQ